MDYIKDACRTEPKDYSGTVNKLNSSSLVRILHASMGLVTEAGELQDQLKKHLIYDKPLDKVNIKEEAGDALWYIALICDEYGWTFDDLMKMNIDKLRVRFPEKFTSENAIDRDLGAERESLESEGGNNCKTV